ncbi:MAG: hypothetical protein H7Y86_03420 [Rhizobacter sp.]|nr:hypothetical protein [Ferruginibacter sp.]
MPEDAGMQFLIYAAAAIIGVIIFYHIIKAAVKAAIIEAKYATPAVYTPVTKQQEPYTTAQITLMAKYERNEISMEDYKAEWEKLK